MKKRSEVAAPPPPPPTMPVALPKPVAVFFEFGMSDLTEDAQQILSQQAALLQSAKVIAVNGYHDATGPLSFNRVLAQRRAESVAQFLIKQGIASEAIHVHGEAQVYFAPNCNVTMNADKSVIATFTIITSTAVSAGEPPYLRPDHRQCQMLGGQW